MTWMRQAKGLNRVRAASMGVAVMLAIAVAPARAQVERNTKPLTPFRIDVNEMIVNATMPFDVKFIVWGDVPAPTTDVSLEIRTVRKDAADCSNPRSGTRKQRTTAKTRKWQASDYPKHDAAAPDDLATQTDLQFEMVIDELEPSRFYCFTFELRPGRKLTPPEAITFSQTLLPGYRTFLQGPPATGVFRLSEQEVEPLRQTLLRALLEASGGRLTPLPGTLFDPGAVPAQVAPEFVADAVEVFDEHTEVTSRLRSVAANARGTAAQSLLEFARSPPMQALENRSGLTDVQARSVKFFRSLTGDQVVNVLLGQLPGGPVSEFPLDVWTPDPGFSAVDDPDFGPDSPCPINGVLAPRCSALDETRRAIAAVASPDFGGLDQRLQTLVGNQKIDLLFAQNAVNRREDLMRLQLTKIQGFLPEQFVLLTTTTGSADTRRAWYLSMDTGIAVAPTLNEIFPYVGTNMYFRPVNTAVPPKGLLTRFSTLFGFTWTDNLSKDGQRKALYGESAMILLGAGLRATEFLRFTGGALVFKAFDGNPLRDETRIELTPFISMSADVDVAGLLGRVFGGDSTPPADGRTLAPK